MVHTCSLGHLIRMPPGLKGRYFRHVRVECNPGVDPKHAGEINYPVWAGNAAGSSWRGWRKYLGRRATGLPCLACYYHDHNSTKWWKMDGWLEHVIYISLSSCVLVWDTQWYNLR